MTLSKAEKVQSAIENAARKRCARTRLRSSWTSFEGPNLNVFWRLGAFIVSSVSLMGKELETDAHVITIEIAPDNAKAAEDNIRRAEIPPTMEILVGDALKLIPTLTGTFDLVFIDAEKSEYLSYLKLVEDKLHNGSVVVADNVRHAPSYLNYVRFSGKYTSRYRSAGWDGLEVSAKR